MGLSNPVFLTVQEINDFLDGFRMDKSVGFSMDNGFREVKTFLERKISEFKEKEETALSLFKYKDLPNLQKEIDKINSSGLLQLSGEAFKKSELGKKFGDNQYSHEEILKGLIFHLQKNDEVKKSLELGLKQNNFEEVRALVEQEIYTVLDKQRDLTAKRTGKKTKASKKNISVNLDLIFEDVLEAIKQQHKRKKSIQVNNKTAFQGYKKELKGFLKTQRILDRTSSFTMTFPENEIEEALENSTGLPSLVFYPYFDLTEKQKVMALNTAAEPGKSTWLNFQDSIAALAPVYRNEIKKVMSERMHPIDFIEANASRVQGILGELQLMIIAEILLEDQYKKGVIFVGNAINENTSKKLGVDVLLTNGLGIQVKNYQGYSGGYWLSKKEEMSWKNLVSKIDNRAGFEEMVDYFSAVSYNKPVTEAVQGYRQLYKEFTSENHPVRASIATLLSKNIGNFFTFEEACNAIMGENQKKIDYRNVFFFFGGKTLIPTSYLLKLLLKRTNELIKSIETGSNSARNFFFTTSYNGDLKYSINKAQQYRQGKAVPPSKESIVNQMGFTFSFNLFLSDLELNSGGPSVTIK